MIQIKRGNESNRSSQNLADGQPLFTLDKHKLYVGSGSVSGGIALTASLSDTASYIDYSNIANKPTLISSSLQFTNTSDVTFRNITSSIVSSSTLIGSLTGTSSYSVTSSYAITAAFALNSTSINTSSFVTNSQTSSMTVLSSSYASTSSYVDYSNVANKPTLISSSLQFNNTNDVTFRNITSSIVSASSIIGTLTGTSSYSVTASYAITAAFALNSTSINTSSFVTNSQTSSMTVLSSSYSLTSSYVDYSNIANKPTLISSSLQFNNTNDVTFRNITSSIVSASTHIGTLIGTSSYSVTSSYYNTSSLINVIQTSSMTVLSSSYSLTSSNLIGFSSYSSSVSNSISLKADYNSLLINSLSSGIISGGIVSINTDPTKFDLTSGSGVIVDDWTNILSPIVYNVTWSNFSAVPVTYLTSSVVSHIGIDKTGTIIQRNSEETNTQRRDVIMVGVLNHTDKTQLEAVYQQYNVLSSPVEQYRDLLQELGLINTGNTITSNGANLKINKSVGTLFGIGLNFNSNQRDPNKVSIASYSPATFRYITQTATGSADVTDIDPTRYDLNGTASIYAGSPNQATNQRIYLFPNGNIRVQYGQTIYSSLSSAIQGIPTEIFVTNQIASQNAVLIGLLSVTKGCTDLSVSTNCRFSSPDKFGQSSNLSSVGGTTTLQQAYTNSTQPQITTDITRDGVALKRGSANDTDVVLQIQSGSGTTLISFHGDGTTRITGSLISPTITGSLLGTASFSLTSSYVLPLTQSVNITGSILLSNELQFSTTATSSVPPTNKVNIYVDNDTITNINRIRSIDSTGATFTFNRDTIFVGKNSSSLDITKGQAVYASGSDIVSGKLTLNLANANNGSTCNSLGIAIENIPTGSFGRILTIGSLSNFNTSTLTQGSPVYLSDSVFGGLTSTVPTNSGSYVVRIGTCISSSVNSGILQVRLSTPLSNTQISSSVSISSSYALTASKIPNVSEDINLFLEAPTNKTYTLIFSASYARTVNSIKLDTVSGTGTASLSINGTYITGISGSGFNQNPAKYVASANNTVNVDNVLSLVISNIVSPVDLAISIDTTKL